jgi:hypothetical protein
MGTVVALTDALLDLRAATVAWNLIVSGEQIISHKAGSRTEYDNLWVAPIGRLQACLACRMSGVVSTPVTSSVAELGTAFGCKQ